MLGEPESPKKPGLPIILPSGEISISPDGTISASGAVAGKLTNRGVCTRHGSGCGGQLVLFGSRNRSASLLPIPMFARAMLESSNVNAVKAVVDMIAVQRHAEMLERAMTVFASNLDHIAANDLPKV